MDLCFPATLTVTVIHSLLPPFSTSLHRRWCGPGAAGEWHELFHGECVLYAGGHGSAPEQRPRARSTPPPPPPAPLASCLPGTRPGPSPSHSAPAFFLPLQGEAAALSAHAHPGRQVEIHITWAVHWFLRSDKDSWGALSLHRFNYVCRKKTALPEEEQLVMFSVCESYWQIVALETPFKSCGRYWYVCLPVDRFCQYISITTAHDAITKVHRFVVEIKIKAEFKDRCGPCKGPKIMWPAPLHFVPLAHICSWDQNEG